MSKFFQPSDQVRVTQPYRIANGAHVLEQPLTQAQQRALEHTQRIAALGDMQPVRVPGRPRAMMLVPCVRAKAGK